MLLSELKLNENNPRTISEVKLEALKKSITEFEKMLSLRPIVVDETGTALGGNMRLRALMALGYKEIPDEWVKRADDLTDEEKRQFIIKDNVGFGEWDWDTLANEWDAEELAEWGLDVPDIWGQEVEAKEDYFEIPDVIETDIVLGDLIEIGRHRLLCGDSTSADDVQKLLQGKEPYLMVTDPPYGVEYDPTWRESQATKGFGAKIKAKGKVQNDDNADWTEAWSLSPSSVAYVWHGGKHAAVVSDSLLKCEFEIRSQIIWAKPSLTFSRGDYHWQHEPCWYAVKRGCKGNWAGDRKQTTLWQIAGINPAGRSNKDEDKVVGHGTQKPVECMARPIGNHDGDVYDPFLGSGTTMVAAHQLGRTCYGMEIDCKYVDVVIRRMLNLDKTLTVNVNGEDQTEKYLQKIV